MKNLLVLFVLLSLTVSLAYPDTTRGDALANVINLIEDSSSLSLFPARLLYQKSAVFLRVGDINSGSLNTVFLPGVQLIQPKMGLSYVYGRSLGTTPAMMANPGVGFVSAPFAAPLSLILGKPGKKMDLAIAYTLGLYSTDTIIKDPNGVISNYQITSYQLHQIRPSISMKIGKHSFLDLSVLLGLQFLKNTDQSPTVTNNVNSGSIFNTIGINAQYTKPFGKKVRGALRFSGGYTNTGYTSISGFGSTNAATNQIINTLIQLDLTAGIVYKVSPKANIFFDILTGYHITDIQNIQDTTNVVSQTDMSSIVLPVSTRLGIEFNTKRWFFRMAVETSMIADVVRNGPNTATTFGALTVSPVIGIGWHKGDWVMNMVINPALFNQTVFLVSGSAVTPILQLSVNYMFPDSSKKKSKKKSKSNGLGDGSQ